MGQPAVIAEDLRNRIISEPDVILDDLDLMRALIAGNDRAIGANVVDLRTVAMARLETRLAQLEETHSTVIAAAYENQAGMNQVHRAILRMLDPVDFEGFLHSLGTDVAQILRVDALRLVLETDLATGAADVGRLSEVMSIAPPGFVQSYLTDGHRAPERSVTLRACDGGESYVYGSHAGRIRSEACLKLDFGDGRLPRMLVLGSHDANTFTPAQATDLLSFFAGTFECSMRRWLA